MTHADVQKVRILRRRGHSVWKISIGLGLTYEEARDCLYPPILPRRGADGRYLKVSA